MIEENQITEIEICGICLEELNISEELENNIYKTICGHLFHSKCIHKSMKKSNICPYCRKELQTPSACCIYENINYIMIYSDYACHLEIGAYAENEDKDCYFTETDDTLYFIMFLFASNFENINYNKFLLCLDSCHNNIKFYPKKILKDFREIAEEHNRWEFEQYTYELNLDTNEIKRYTFGKERNPNSVLLMNKSFEWKLYEKEYEIELIEDYRNNNIN